MPFFIAMPHCHREKDANHAECNCAFAPSPHPPQTAKERAKNKTRRSTPFPPMKNKTKTPGYHHPPFPSRQHNKSPNNKSIHPLVSTAAPPFALLYPTLPCLAFKHPPTPLHLHPLPCRFCRRACPVLCRLVVTNESKEALGST